MREVVVMSLNVLACVTRINHERIILVVFYALLIGDLYNGEVGRKVEDNNDSLT